MVSQPVNIVSDKFRENYDLINWNKSYMRAVKPRIQDNTPVKTIKCIRDDKPHYSEAAAIHVDQVEAFNKKCARGTHYEPGTGRLVSTSSAARLRELRRRGLTDSWS